MLSDRRWSGSGNGWRVQHADDLPRSGMVSVNGWQRSGHPRIVLDDPGMPLKTPVSNPGHGATGVRISWGQLAQDE